MLTPSRNPRFPSVSRPTLLGFGAATALASGFFVLLLILNIPSDIPLHSEDVARFIDRGRLPGHFLFFVVAAAVSLYSTNFWVVLLVSYSIVAVCVGAKFLAVRGYLRNQLQGVEKISAWQLTGYAFAFVLVYSIPVSWSSWYISYLPPTLWHNATTIFLMPWAIGLFWCAVLYLKNPDRLNLLVLVVLMVINVMAKPTYFTCFAVAFPVVVLLRYRFLAAFWQSILAVSVAGALFLALFLGIATGTGQHVGSGIAFAPAIVWEKQADYFLVRLLTSVFFPLLVTVLQFTQARRDPAMQLSWLAFLIGLACFLTLTETGIRAEDGNFASAPMIANFMLFLASFVLMLRERFSKAQPTAIDNVLAGAFGLHVIAGVGYLVKIIVLGNYY